MKQLPMFLLMIPLLVTLVAAPAMVSAKGGDDDWDDDEDESGLEVEADVFTDTTIVKVEINDKKTIFATEADTREAVVDAVVAKFNLNESEVDSVLEFEIEDRASRPQDRGKLNRDIKREKHENKGKKWGHNASSTPKVCRDDDSTLQIEADVFTDTTVVKVEFVNAKDEVFTTSATSSAGIVAAVANRYSSLSTSSIEAALDIDIEDRASRADDKVVDKDCVGSGVASSTTPVVNEAKLSELRARIAELQTMLERLIALMRGN